MCSNEEKFFLKARSSHLVNVHYVAAERSLLATAYSTEGQRTNKQNALHYSASPSWLVL